MYVARVAVLVALFAAPCPARADDDRLAFVEDALARDASPSRLWYFGWTAAYTVATAASVTLAFVGPDASTRASSRVGIVTSALGLITTVILPPKSLFYTPCAPNEERAACYARQKERLDDAASVEAFGRSIWAHVAVVLVNTAAGVYLWLHDHELASGVVATAVGIAVGELQIFTEPTIARDAKRTLDARSSAPRPSFGFLPIRGGGALLVGASFTQP